MPSYMGLPSMEPPPSKRELKPMIPDDRFANVQGGGSVAPRQSYELLGMPRTESQEMESMVMDPNAALFQPSAPAQAPESHLRYDLGDGQGMREFKHGQEPSIGTYSMMTAPENADRVTFASQMEDLDMQNALASRRRELQMAQPYERGMELPPLTVGEAVQRENAQQTLRRLEEREHQIEMDRQARVDAGMPAALTDKDKETLRSSASDDAMAAYRRALMAEQLAMGKGLPGAAYDNRYR